MRLQPYLLFDFFVYLGLFQLSYSKRLASPGCSHALDARLRPGGPSQFHNIHSSVGGGTRKFLLYLPPSYKRGQPSPLILAFHGQDQLAAAFEKETRFSESEHNRLNAIVVYPQGLEQQWTGDPRSPPTSEVNDILFVGELLDHLQSTYCIANDRVYAAGFSNGGGLTQLLACNTALSKRFAAFAASSAAIYKGASLKETVFDNCPSRKGPIPFLEFHGTDDPVIDYEGVATPDGVTYSVPETMVSWAVRNGCPIDAPSKSTDLHGGTVQKFTWTCGRFEDVVTHYRIDGMGHGWTSTWAVDNEDQRHGPTPVDGTAVVMGFFAEWRLPADLVLDANRDEL